MQRVPQFGQRALGRCRPKIYKRCAIPFRRKGWVRGKYDPDTLDQLMLERFKFCREKYGMMGLPQDLETWQELYPEVPAESLEIACNFAP